MSKRKSGSKNHAPGASPTPAPDAAPRAATPGPSPSPAPVEAQAAPSPAPVETAPAPAPEPASSVESAAPPVETRAAPPATVSSAVETPPPPVESAPPRTQPAPAATQPAAPKKPRRLFWKIVLALLVLGLVIGGYLLWRINSYPDRKKEGAGSDLVFVLTPGRGPKELASLLQSAGAIEDADAFAYYLRFSGRLKDLKAGEHVLRDDMTPREVVDRLVKPPQAIQVSVTVPEGKNLREMAPLFEAAGVCSAEAFLKAAKSPELAQKYGIPNKSFEGYLFPDTYRFKPNTEPEKVLAAMKKRHDEVFDEGKRARPKEWEALQADLGWTDRELVVFASLVEKETGAESERGLIASVFLNRLLDPAFTPKYLATDPTIIYGLMESPGGFDGDIKTKDLRDTSNPYNTYVHPGLPPGPITNFGKAALDAALATPGSRCYFFVAKGDGTSFFSEKEELHKRAVDIYQRRMAGATASELRKAPDCSTEPARYTRKSGFVSPVTEPPPPAIVPKAPVSKPAKSSTPPGTSPAGTTPTKPTPPAAPAAPAKPAPAPASKPS